MIPIRTNKKTGFFPQLVSDFLDNSRFAPNWFESEFNQSFPAVNIRETEKNFAVEFAAPGFKKTDFKISADNNILTVGAEKKEEKNENKEGFTRKEFSYNSFSRSFSLPQHVNAEKIDAKYNDGILALTIPKKDGIKTNPKKEIKVA